MTSPAERRSPVDFSDPAELDLAFRIGRAWIDLRRGARNLREYLYGTEHPLVQGQMDALDLLTRRDRTMSGIAERMKIDRSTATRAVDSLVENGLAERYTSIDDGRVVMVRITAGGRRRHAEVAARRTELMAGVLAAFDPEERRLFAGYLERFIEAVDDHIAELG